MNHKLIHDCYSEKYPQSQHWVSKIHLIRRKKKGARMYAHVIQDFF